MTQEVVVPDIGDYKDVEIIDIAVKSGDEIAQEDVLITLETEKAAMEIPSPFAGKITKLNVSLGDKVSQGSVILTLEQTQSSQPKKQVKESPKQESKDKQPSAPKIEKASLPIQQEVKEPKAAQNAFASPGMRRFAHSLGVDLTNVRGSGRKGRIVKQDVETHVSNALSKPSANNNLDIMPFKEIDFSVFGDVDPQPLGRIKKISGSTLHRNWVGIPHVTHFDEANISELEEFRQQQKPLAEKKGIRLTPLVFIIKAVIAGLKKFPQVNASLNLAADTLYMKKYFHIGVAVDTPNGLVVPVIQNADQKGLLELAQELGEISKKAREGKLTAKQMQGGCFSISSLGGIGGIGFTPIINSPEVAILGVSKSKFQQVYESGKFVPRLMLPVALSYDHRVIDGAEAARFTSFVVQQLADIRKLLL